MGLFYRKIKIVVWFIKNRNLLIKKIKKEETEFI